jgi:hypothetical protein
MTRNDTPVGAPQGDLAELLRRGPSRNTLRHVTGLDAPVRLVRTHFSDRRPLQLVYAQGTHTVLAEVHHEAAEEAAESLRRRLAKARRGLNASLDPGAVVADPDAGLVLHRPGLDTRLPGLRLLHDAGEARLVLERIEGRDPGAVAVTLMAHRPGKRAVLRLSGGDGVTRYGRLRTDKSTSGLTAFARHRALWDKARDELALALPEPLGEDPTLGLALFSELPGAPPVFSRFEGFRACNAIGEALLSLQALRLPDLPRHDGADEARLLQTWLERLVAVYPAHAERVRIAVAEVCADLLASRIDPAPCHRDLHEKQILIHQGRAGLLDFDTLSLGDPAMDVGNLMAHLFLAGIADQRNRGAFEQAIGFAMRHLRGRRRRLWRRAALLRLSMIYAFTHMPVCQHDALLREAVAPHD